MTAPLSPRAQLKFACLSLLDASCAEHSAGHQAKLAARYVLVSYNGERVGMIFEKFAQAPAFLWLQTGHASIAGGVDCQRREYPAASLYAGADAKGKPVYGRHAALRQMRDLANVDLVRLEIDNVEQLAAILEALRNQ